MITPGFSLTSTERILPRVSIDFTSASLDARIALTRALNTATRTNSSGTIETINADLPRFDYDPVTLRCRGLLIEQASQNKIVYSTFTSGWSVQNTVLVNNSTTAPDGTNTGSLLYPSSSGDFRALRYTAVGYPWTTNSSFSFYAKNAGRNFVTVLNSTGSFQGISFNLTTGAVRVIDTTYSGTCTAAKDGWWRCTVSSLQGVNYIWPADNNNTTFVTANGTEGIYLWGAQFEDGLIPTSYIPATAGAAVSRNADVALTTGTNFSSWWTSSIGSAVLQTLPSSIVGVRPGLQFDDNTADNLICLRGNVANPELYIKATTDQAQIDAGTLTASTLYNLGAAWGASGSAAALNGDAAITASSANIPAVTQARWGSDGTNYLNGHLQKFYYWPQRITNAETRAFSKL